MGFSKRIIYSKVFTFLFLFLSIVLVAQQQGSLKITGVVYNANQQKVSSAEVYLFTAKNELVKTAIVDDGRFEFTEVLPASYYLQIHTSNTIQTEEVFHLSENKFVSIVLTDAVSNIEELKILNKRKPFQLQKGTISVDVANSVLNKVPNTTDLLAKLPSITIDSNGEGLSMLGKGVPLLYIDNQHVDFSTLSALSVDDIKSIEIIRNPSAKYEAEGKAVIRVILKNSKKEGYKLTLNDAAVFNKRFSNTFSANFQQKKNKTEWKLNGAYNQIQHWESNGFEYSVPSKSIVSDYIIKSVTNRPQIILGANIFHELNEGDYLTLAINANLRPDKGENTTVTNYDQNAKKTHIRTLDYQDRQRATINSIFNYTKQIKSINATIFSGLQFTRESNIVDHDFYNSVDFSAPIFSQFRKQNYGVNAFSGRVDVEKKIAEEYQLSVGGSFTKAEAITDNSTDYKNENPIELFKYIFNEKNWASYVEFLGTKEKVSFKGGLRMEATAANGFNQELKQTSIDRHYVDWFPNAELSFTPSNDYIYTLNFNRNISRPSYSDLASGGLYSSPYVEYEGNPNLLPTYTSTITATANLKKWTLSASVYQSKDPIGFGLFYDETRNISKFTTKNFDREIGASFGVDVPLEYKIISSQNSLSVNYSEISDSLAKLGKSTPYLYFYTNTTVKLGKGFNFLLDGSWISKRVQGLYTFNEMLIVNLGLTKSISNFDITLRYNDIFKQNTFVQELNYDKIITKGSFYGNTPVFSVALKYTFGKVSNSEYKEKQVNSTMERI